MDQRLVEANAAYQKGDYIETIAIYQAVLKENSENELAHQGIAQCLVKLGKFDDAFLEAQKALEINNNLAISHLIVALVFMKKINFRKVRWN